MSGPANKKEKRPRSRQPQSLSTENQQHARGRRRGAMQQASLLRQGQQQNTFEGKAAQGLAKTTPNNVCKINPDV
jgi:hypothetical protein